MARTLFDKVWDAHVVRQVPVHGADMRKEPVGFGRFLKDLVVERARIPAHDDIAYVPQDGLCSRPRHISLAWP